MLLFNLNILLSAYSFIVSYAALPFIEEPMKYVLQVSSQLKDNERHSSLFLIAIKNNC